MQAFQHGEPCVERVIATESERVGAGQGEMYAAQQNVEFVARLVRFHMKMKILLFQSADDFGATR